VLGAANPPSHELPKVDVLSSVVSILSISTFLLNVYVERELLTFDEAPFIWVWSSPKPRRDLIPLGSTTEKL